MGLCCCCGSDDPSQKYPNESVIVVNDEGAITSQPTNNKSNNSSFRFNPSSHSNGFVNDAVDFDEIDLNERQVSVRSKDRSNHNSINSKPTNNNNNQTKPNEETINVTGLMLDQLYEDDKPKETEQKVTKADDNDDHLSREIVEEYDFDPNVITEATEDEVHRASTKSPDESLHRLTINLADETFGSTGALTTSEPVSVEPTPAPRTKASSTTPPDPPSVSPPQWSPLENCHDEEMHETTKSPFELGVNDLEITPRDNMPTTSVSTEPSDHDDNENKPPYPANDDAKMIHDQIKQNRMYGGFSSSSSSSDSDNENDDFELESTDRQHEPKNENYSVLMNEETDKSNAG